jgi:hypothetical protein
MTSAATVGTAEQAEQPVPRSDASRSAYGACGGGGGGGGSMCSPCAGPRCSRLPRSFVGLLVVVSAAQSMTTSLLTLLFMAHLEPQQSTLFWTFMSWIYWCSPVSGWVSDVCGNRKALLVAGLGAVVAAWCLIAYVAESFASFVAFGALQNASMLFVNAAINGALVEVAGEPTKTGRDANDEAADRSEAAPALAPLPPRATAASEFETDPIGAPLLTPRNQRVLVNDTEDDGGGVAPAADAAAPTTAATRMALSGATQAAAMTARSCGSVLGGVVQTFLLVKMEIRAALSAGICIYLASIVVAWVTDFTPSAEAANAATAGAAATASVSVSGRILGMFRELRTLCGDSCLAANGAGAGEAAADAGKRARWRNQARDAVIILAFIFGINMLPDATSFYMSYVFNDFRFPNWFNSTYLLGNLIGALIACEVYRRWFAAMSQTKVFVAGCFCAAVSYVTGVVFCLGFTRDVLHISNAAYLMVDCVLVGFMNRLAFMPVIHVASARCPKGYEAIVFELFSLAAIGGTSVASLVTIRVADALHISRSSFGNVWILMLVSAGSRLLPIFLVPHLPPPQTEDELRQREAEQARQQQQRRAEDQALLA